MGQRLLLGFWAAWTELKNSKSTNFARRVELRMDNAQKSMVGFCEITKSDADRRWRCHCYINGSQRYLGERDDLRSAKALVHSALESHSITVVSSV